MTTPHVEITEFDPVARPDAELQGIFEVVAAANALDSPELPPVTLESIAGRLRHPQPNLAPARRWSARQDGRDVALASLYFPPAENNKLGILELVVHPDARRGGVGTAVLRAIAPALRADGRKVVESWNIPKDSVGEHFARALDFRVACTTVFQVLSLRDVDRTALAIEPAAGYSLQSWHGAAPDDLVESYAYTRWAIADGPFGRSAYQFPDWTSQRVREAEADQAQLKTEHRVVAAVRQDSGEVVGFTELQLYPHRQDTAYQGDTAVLPEHRGHGPGFCVKASMLRWLLDEHPRREQLYTSTAATNSYMIGVNHRLGYRDANQMLVLAQDVDKLAGE
jgi:GNAT superfamily N-acetyltransferase